MVSVPDIARLTVRAPGELVAELGSGLGHLTARLLARGGARRRRRAGPRHGPCPPRRDGRSHRAPGGGCARLDYARLAAEHGRGGRVAIAGNLPYDLTSPILFSLVDQPERIERAVLLLQREVAERLAVPPGESRSGGRRSATRSRFSARTSDPAVARKRRAALERQLSAGGVALKVVPAAARVVPAPSAAPPQSNAAGASVRPRSSARLPRTSRSPPMVTTPVTSTRPLKQKPPRPGR